MEPSSVALIVVGSLFAAFILVRLFPGARRGGRADLRSAQEAVRAATTPRARAEALLDLALRVRAAGGATRAAAYVARGLRADPTWLEGYELAASVLRGRPRLLERVVLRRLEPLSLTTSRDVARAAFGVLANAYTSRPLERARARLYGKLAAEL